MQFTASTITAIMAIFSAQGALACCAEGCYSVKGEAFQNVDCTGTLNGASIADYGGPNGACLDIRSSAGLKAHNDGCGSSHPTFDFYSDLGCTKKLSSVGKTGGGECFAKPAGAVAMIVVSN